jgi:hypothetical protein
MSAEHRIYSADDGGEPGGTGGIKVATPEQQGRVAGGPAGRAKAGGPALSGLPRPNVPAGPVRALFDGLHELHHRAGWPSLRDMARDVGCSHTTVSVAFSEPRVPRWGLLELIVETLGGDTEEFHRLWLAASRAPEHRAPTIAAGAAAPQAAPLPPRELPADVVAFTGRAEQVATLDALLAQADTAPAVMVSAVSGTAGVGKPEPRM